MSAIRGLGSTADVLGAGTDPEPRDAGSRTLEHRLNLIGGLALALVVAALPPLLGDFRLSTMVFVAIFALATMGLCLLMGYAGQVSLGHAAFYGLGAYVSGLLSTKLGWTPWVTLVVAAALTAAVAYLIGIPILRLRGHYLAMATLGLGIIVHIGLVELVDLTGGPSGFSGIPYLSIGGFAFDRDVEFYYLAWGVVLVATVLALNVVNSRVGRALRAIHGSELAAATLGVDTARYKTQVFALSAAYASVAGSLYAHYVTFISPAPFGFGTSVELLVMAAVGSLASVWGAIFGAAVIVLLTEAIRDLLPELLGRTGGEQEIILFGIILVAVMVLLPEGLSRGVLGALRRRSRADAARRNGSRDGPVPRGLVPHAGEPAGSAADRADPATPVAAGPAGDGVLLETRSLCRAFGGVTALSGVNARVQRGEILAVIGPNGAGKTTLLNVISGVLPPTRGETIFDERPITGLPPHRVAALGIARTFQNLQLFSQMTVLENVLVARETKGRTGLLAAALRLPGAVAEERRLRREALSVLALLGLEERAAFLASELPFGQQRLLEIARALATEPRLLLLDEPAAGLSAAERSDLRRVIGRIRDLGTTIFLVEHDMGLVMELAGRVVVLNNGEKIADASPAQVQSDESVIAAYLGVDEE